MCNSKQSNLLIDCYPDLFNQLHTEKNDSTLLHTIKIKSTKKVWWKCEKDHEWEAIVSNRVNRGSGCPYCTGILPSEENCLEIRYPEVAKEWHPTKNGELTAKDVLPHSNKRVWWKCQNGHEYEYQINNKTKGIPCATCSSMGHLLPHLLPLWNTEKNKGLTPFQLFHGSSKKVWWKCEKGHEWDATVATVKKNGNCPYCTNKRVCDDNSLLATHPEIASQWHPTKNGTLTPHMVVAGSGRKVWWQCEKGHEWDSVIGSRKAGTGCPTCQNEKQTSFPEQTLFFYLKQVFNEVENRHVFTFNKNKIETDLYIKDINLAIEYDGAYYHSKKNRIKHDERKNLVLKNNKITLIRIRESGCPELNMYGQFSLEYLYSSNHSKLSDAIQVVFSLIKENFSLTSNQLEKINSIEINIDKDRSSIFDSYISEEKKNNLEYCFPDVAKEWNYEKNGNLKPSQVTRVSNKQVWWKCEKGHEWPSKIGNRTILKRGCPYCAGLKVCDDNSLEMLLPEIAKEWNYEKNKGLTPKDVSHKSDKKVWWKCEKDHEWKTTINHRANGTKCPYCSGRKVCAENSLSAIRPDIATEWHPTKNYPLTSDNVTSGSDKKVWWKCKEGHEWETQICTRTHPKKGTGCPYCSGSKVTPENSIASTYKELMKEWHYAKNVGLDPYTYSKGSSKKVWWICGKGHEWDTKIYVRTLGSGCPTCFDKKPK